MPKTATIRDFSGLAQAIQTLPAEIAAPTAVAKKPTKKAPSSTRIRRAVPVAETKPTAPISNGPKWIDVGIVDYFVDGEWMPIDCVPSSRERGYFFLSRRFLVGHSHFMRVYIEGMPGAPKNKKAGHWVTGQLKIWMEDGPSGQYVWATLLASKARATHTVQVVEVAPDIVTDDMIQFLGSGFCLIVAAIEAEQAEMAA